jgi:hypothetical protein
MTVCLLLALCGSIGEGLAGRGYAESRESLLCELEWQEYEGGISLAEFSKLALRSSISGTLLDLRNVDVGTTCNFY